MCLVLCSLFSCAIGSRCRLFLHIARYDPLRCGRMFVLLHALSSCMFLFCIRVHATVSHAVFVACLCAHANSCMSCMLCLAALAYARRCLRSYFACVCVPLRRWVKQTYDHRIYPMIGARFGGHFGAILGYLGASGADLGVSWGALGLDFWVL